MPVLTLLWCIVFKERIYKIWKQFTTWTYNICKNRLLCSKNEYTKSESNSQLRMVCRLPMVHCVQRTNIQNLKAIHNSWWAYLFWWRLCSKNEYTKSESNSQPLASCNFRDAYCVQRTNIQNLKAIHNKKDFLCLTYIIVFKERIYKIWKQFTTNKTLQSVKQWLCSKNEYTKSESNSQLQPVWGIKIDNCVQRTNIQNLKAIHNNRTENINCSNIVFKERIYKIWKQFTTFVSFPISKWLLCSKNEYTKSESNSQHFSLVGKIWLIVFKERIYKIWKQFTTCCGCFH